MINIKTSFTFQTSEDSWLQISPDGKITYRLNSKFLSNWNKAMTTIGRGAAQIAATYTPFSFFRSSWDAKYEYANKGMVSSITIYNKLINSNIKYQSQYADSGKWYNFPVSYAIAMLEKGRKIGYPITPHTAKALTVGMGAKGKPLFAKKVTVKSGGSKFRTEPVTNAKKYLIRAVKSYFANVKASGIIQAAYNEDLQFYKGNYFGGTSAKSIGTSASKQTYQRKQRNLSARHRRARNFRNGGEEE